MVRYFASQAKSSSQASQAKSSIPTIPVMLADKFEDKFMQFCYAG
jgi:hypothetical protein